MGKAAGRDLVLGVAATLYTVPGGGHGGFQDPRVETLVAEFFRRRLYQ